MSDKASKDLEFLFFIINRILAFIRQDINVSTLKKHPCNPFIPWIVILSSCYAIYLLRCLTKMKDLDAISEILWILPLMIQYCFKAVNGEVQREIALELKNWMKRVMCDDASEEWVARIVKSNNEKCMRVATFIFR